MSEHNQKTNNLSPTEEEMMLFINEIFRKIDYLGWFNKVDPTDSTNGEDYQGYLIELDQQNYEYICNINIHCPGNPSQIVSIEPAPKEYALRLAKTYIDGRIAVRCEEFKQITETFEEFTKIKDQKEEIKHEFTRLREKKQLVSLKIKNYKQKIQNNLYSGIFGITFICVIPAIAVSLIQNNYARQPFSFAFFGGAYIGIFISLLHFVPTLRSLNNYLKQFEMEE